MGRRPKIKIDEDFQNLICPLKPCEYTQLEENLIQEGCRNPILLWKGYIVDGHNRYEICNKHNIHYKIANLEFNDKNEAMAWICRNQLGRRNISLETRRYLIGRQYACEKLKGRGKQHIPTKEGIHTKTAIRIGEENQIAAASVQKYGIYSACLDAITEKCPELTKKILSGKYKISHNNVLGLSELSDIELNDINNRLERNSKSYVQYQTAREIIADKELTHGKISTVANVKDMPEYDPDSTAIELCLTIPSWISSIQRMDNNTKMDEVSTQTKEKLHQNLIDLRFKITSIIAKLGV